MDSKYLASVPEPVLDIGRRLDERTHDAVLVGGAVRDAFLDTTSVNWDLATDASTDEIREIASGTAGVRSLYDVGERFGTLGVALEDGSRLEVSRYRPHALAASTLVERFAIDAQHRDFTVNAVGVDLASGTVLDPLDGKADLMTRLLRAPGDPQERLTEDPLRAIRAARFVAELCFDLEAKTAAALPTAAAALNRIAPERIREELTRLLVAPLASKGLEVLNDSRALDAVLPEVAALDGVTQPTFHDLDVLAHTIQAVDLAPRTPVLRWATLLHDVGKGVTRTVEQNGRIRFFGHARAGAETARVITARLRFSTHDAKAIVHLVATHMRLGEVDFASPRSIDRAVRRLDLRVDDATQHTLVSAEDAVELTLADFAATAHRHEAPALRRVLEDALAASRERGTRRAVVSPISGFDIMRSFGLAEGPEVGVAKGAVEAAIENGDLAPDDIKGAFAVAGAALGYDLEAGRLRPGHFRSDEDACP